MHTNDIISALSDAALLQSLSALSERENQTTVELLLHLGEVEKRRLYVPAGYSSLFAYCTQKLKYSEPAANRRISCARVLINYPALVNKLLPSALSLTTLSLASGILTQENYREVTAAIRGRSRREVEEYLYRPRVREPREQLKPVMILKPKKEEAGSLFETSSNMPPQRGKSSIISTFAREGKSVAGIVSPANPTPSAETPALQKVKAPEPTLEQRYELKFTIGADTRQKLEEAKQILSGKYPRGVKLEDVLEEALEFFLEGRSSKRRIARRDSRKAKQEQKTKNHYPKPVEVKKPNRHIPAGVKDEVRLRDGGQCTFVSADGVRCREKTALELHHQEPYALGGGNGAGNIHLLCRQHNRLEAERVYGKGFMAEKIMR